MGGPYVPVDTSPPEEQLSKIFKDELGVDINPQALRLLLRWQWHKMQTLAHKIHDGK